jgi:hypothetical protein
MKNWLTFLMLIVFYLSPSFASRLSLKTYQFDTERGEPILPIDLITTEDDDPNYYIVQLLGPIQREWKEEIKASGAEILGYIPNYAYLVRMDKQIKSMLSIKQFVKWIGLWHPAYKIHPELQNKAGIFQVIILVHEPEDLNDICIQIRKTDAHVIDTTGCISKWIIAEINSSMLTNLANNKGISWIEPYVPIELHNNLTVRWVQSGASGDTTIWAKGLRGEGQILGTTDTGITTAHWAFYDASYPITTWGSFPNHRKIRNYSRGGPSATFGDESDNSWHGTHTAGTVCGDDSYNGGTSVYDGMAKLAKLSFCDIGYSDGLSTWSDLNQLWDTTYYYGARIVSNSWGAVTNGYYYVYDAQADQFMWRRKNCLLVISAGNYGPSSNTTASPGNAKNVLTVGSVGRNNPTSIADYSSRGPTDDNRYKPTLMAPGGLDTSGDPGLYSAKGSTSGSSSSYWQLAGTSMASPAAAGAVGLIREYLNKGYYPTGSQNPGNAISNPSAALLKAMAMVSTDPDIYDYDYTVPDYDIGWGRIDLDSVLYFTGETRKLLLHDSISGGLDTGDSVLYQWTVNSSPSPLRVTLCWSDTAGFPAATFSLVNDLDLRVISPSGTPYWGNYYSGGQSAPGGTRDSINAEENFRLTPAIGTWKAWVVGRNVPTGSRQPYAITISGDVSNLEIGIAENKSDKSEMIHRISMPSLTRGNLYFTFYLKDHVKTKIAIYNVLGARVYSEIRSLEPGLHKMNIDLSSFGQGVYFMRLEADYYTKTKKIFLLR